MTRFALIAGLSVAMLAGAAQAQDQLSRDAYLEGHVDGACRMYVPQAAGGENMTAGAVGEGAVELAISNLVDAAGVPRAASIVVTVPAICTQAHTLTVTSRNDGLRTEETAPPGSGFRSVIDYTVGVGWAGSTTSFDASSGELVEPVADAAAGDVTLTISFPGGGDPAVAGFYSDEIILELGVAG